MAHAVQNNEHSWEILNASTASTPHSPQSSSPWIMQVHWCLF